MSVFLKFEVVVRCFVLALFVAFSASMSVKANEWTHGIAMHGAPELPKDFKHFPYANPNAPKGGKITYGVRGSFDSVNPFILRGQKVAGLRDSFYGNNVYESLMIRSRNEPFAMYGLLAEAVKMPDDRSFIEFRLHPKAAFSDGEPVKVEDVIFSANLLAEKGRPNYRKYYSRIKSIDKTGERSVRFTFNEDADREVPLLLSLLPILPKHAINPEEFDKTTLTPIIGSGPYRLTKVDQGSGITLTKNPDYWAKDEPAKAGFDNFQTIEITYYRDRNALFEAFKKGLVDVYFEIDPENWTTAYKGKALSEGRIVQSEFVSKVSKGVRGYAFNTRRPALSDKNVRKALSMLFDFEWMNANLFSGGYTRTSSFFQGSNLSALKTAASRAEMKLLTPYKELLDEDVLKGTFKQTVTDGSGRDRKVFRKALQLFREAGFNLKDRVLHDQQGKPFSVELMIPAGGNQNRVALSYAQNLKALGIKLVVRPVDAAQFEERRKSFDFDMLFWRWAGSLSPGNEQYFRWSSPLADQQGSFNFSGVKNPGVDAMIDALVAAKDRPEFVDAVRALDRLLISGYYVLPHYHLGRQLVAHSSRLKFSENPSLYGVRPETAWIQETK